MCVCFKSSSSFRTAYDQVPLVTCLHSFKLSIHSHKSSAPQIQVGFCPLLDRTQQSAEEAPESLLERTHCFLRVFVISHDAATFNVKSLPLLVTEKHFYTTLCKLVHSVFSVRFYLSLWCFTALSLSVASPDAFFSCPQDSPTQIHLLLFSPVSVCYLDSVLL